MMSLNTWGLAVMVCCWANLAGARLEMVSNAAPESIFCGPQKQISVTFHNAGGQDVDGQIRTRIYQTTSASAVSIGEQPWKKLQVLPGQTVLESARLDFPAVNAETLFLIQWIADSNRVLGTTSVLVYPTNLFQTLQPFLGKRNFGVFDPDNQLKPLLKMNGISFADLGEMRLDDFSGKLAIIGPFQSKTQVPQGLGDRIKAIARRNVAVVWIQPPVPELRPARVGWEREKLQPSFYCVQKKETAVVIVQPELIADLAENPQSQIALIYLCHLALDPKPPALPDAGLSPDPNECGERIGLKVAPANLTTEIKTI